MTERKRLIEIQYVTDHDTGMYQVGETDFSYAPDDLEEYIRRYGPDDLLGTLNHFIYEVLTLRRKNARSRSGYGCVPTPRGSFCGNCGTSSGASWTTSRQRPLTSPRRPARSGPGSRKRPRLTIPTNWTAR